MNILQIQSGLEKIITPENCMKNPTQIPILINKFLQENNLTKNEAIKEVQNLFGTIIRITIERKNAVNEIITQAETNNWIQAIATSLQESMQTIHNVIEFSQPIQD